MTQNKINQGFYLQCVLEVFNIVAIDIYNQQSIKDINKRCVMQSREIFDYDRSFCKSAESVSLHWNELTDRFGSFRYITHSQFEVIFHAAKYTRKSYGSDNHT